MEKKIFLKNKNLNLVKVNYSLAHIKFLFSLLKDRNSNYNISHSKLPNFNEHKKFVQSIPYRYWFLIFNKENIIGASYVSRLNEISIRLTEEDYEVYKEILNLIIKNIKPLRAIASKRNKNFVINISPKEKYYAKFLNK